MDCDTDAEALNDADTDMAFTTSRLISWLRLWLCDNDALTDAFVDSLNDTDALCELDSDSETEVEIDAA